MTFRKYALCVFLSCVVALLPGLGADSTRNGVALTAGGTVNGVTVSAISGMTLSSAGSTPNYSAEVQRGATGGDTSIIIVLTGAIASGHTIGVICGTSGNKITGVVDSQSNTYTVQKTGGHDGNATAALSIATAYAGTPLGIADTITVTFDNLGFQTNGYIVLDLTACTNPASSSLDATGFFTGTAFATSVSASASNTTANTIIIGAIGCDVQTNTYTGGGWNAIGAAHDVGARRFYYVYKQTTSAAAQAPAGGWGGNVAQVNVWTALK